MSLKYILASEDVMLLYPDYQKPFDCLIFGLGAVLSHPWKPINMIFRTLVNNEQNSQQTNASYAQIHYKPGKKNFVTDALSMQNLHALDDSPSDLATVWTIIMSGHKTRYTGCLWSVCSHQEIVLLAPNFFSQVGTKLQVILSINFLFTSHLKLTCQRIFWYGKKLISRSDYILCLKRTVEFWAGEFKRGPTRPDDDPRKGRPKTETTTEIIEQVHNIVSEDPSLATSISEERVLHILYGELHMEKLFGMLVSHTLTIQQKLDRKQISPRNLERFKQNKIDFLRRFITMDETWIYHHYPKYFNQQ